MTTTTILAGMICVMLGFAGGLAYQERRVRYWKKQVEKK